MDQIGQPPKQRQQHPESIKGLIKTLAILEIPILLVLLLMSILTSSQFYKVFGIINFSVAMSIALICLVCMGSKSQNLLMLIGVLNFILVGIWISEIIVLIVFANFLKGGQAPLHIVFAIFQIFFLIIKGIYIIDLRDILKFNKVQSQVQAQRQGGINAVPDVPPSADRITVSEEKMQTVPPPYLYNS